ncbi:MAG: hypothetical protein JXM73_13330 [Anaerolineae bacterium]|nr:hypothetical protein [Anaerolineae bacterium]
MRGHGNSHAGSPHADDCAGYLHARPAAGNADADGHTETHGDPGAAVSRGFVAGRL